MTQTPIFAMPEDIACRLLFIDGLTCSGKSILSNIIPSLAGIEQIKFSTMLEHLMPALAFGAVNKEYAKASIRALMNEMAYDTLLARNSNFRPNDQTGILNFHDPKLYFERLARKEGNEVVDELRQKQRQFPFMTHDFMVNLVHLESLEIDYKMIQLYRHPIDNSYSFYKQGYCTRWTNDPREFSLMIGFESHLLPWYCAGYEQEWLSLNPLERAVRIILDLLSRSINQHKTARSPNNILTITFDSFVENTTLEMDRISSFLGSAQTTATPYFLKQANCPRKLISIERRHKLDEFKAGISNNLFCQLKEYSDRYETNLYELTSINR